MRRLFLFTIAVVVVSRPLNAQIAVYDPANTARNSISATIKEYLLETQREQHAKIRRMARRLSVFADLRRFVGPQIDDQVAADFGAVERHDRDRMFAVRQCVFRGHPDE